MKNFFNRSGMLALFAGVLLTSCDPDIDAPASSAGEVDFTKYVAVGNSLTAGFSDGGLYREGQLSSYPAILAQQFKLVGGGEFTQPLFSEAQKNGSGYLQVTGFAGDPPQPVTANVMTDLAIRGMGADQKTFLYTKYLEPVNNLGVPGIKMTDVTTAGYGFNNPVGFNPYYERLLPDGVTNGALTPYVAKVAETKPTFFTMWLGNNDVLGYATSGGTGAISESEDFQRGLDAMTAALMSQENTKGVIINIPDVTGIPYFTTKATSLLMARAAAAQTKLYITTGDGSIREATTSDYILLTSTVGTPEPVGPMVVPHGFSQFNPLKNNEVLDNAEVEKVKAATTSFNAKLAAAAQAKNLAFVDMNAFFNSIQVRDGEPQFSLNAISYTPAFITGNLFSLDGVHLTPRGYAIVANEIIKGINTKYGSRIPTVNETQYRGVVLP